MTSRTVIEEVRLAQYQLECAIEQMGLVQHQLDCAIDDISGTVVIEVERIVENLEQMEDAHDYSEVRDAIGDLHTLADRFRDAPVGET